MWPPDAGGLVRCAGTRELVRIWTDRTWFFLFSRESESGTRSQYGHQHSSTSGLSILSLLFLFIFSPPLHPPYSSIFTSLFSLSLSFTTRFLTISPRFVRTPLTSIQFVTAFFLGCLVIYNTYRLRTGPISVGDILKVRYTG